MLSSLQTTPGVPATRPSYGTCLLPSAHTSRPPPLLLPVDMEAAVVIVLVLVILVLMVERHRALRRFASTACSDSTPRRTR